MQHKQLGRWIVLSVALHCLLLVVPLTSLSLSEEPVVEVLLVGPAQDSGGQVPVRAGKVSPRDQSAAPKRKTNTAAERHDAEPSPSATDQHPVRAEDRSVAAAADAFGMVFDSGPDSSGSTSAKPAGQTSYVGVSGSTTDALFGAAGGPSFIRQEKPVYPSMAKKFGREGRVVLRLTIDEKGVLSNVEVLEEAGFGFTESALEAVKRSVFAPAVRNGQPVVSRALLPIRFTLKTN